MTMLPSPTIVYHVLTDEMLERLVTEKAEAMLAAQKKKTEVPLNRKEVARKFNRSVDYVDKHWRHLRHQPESGSAYWFASEIENYLKEQ